MKIQKRINMLVLAVMLLVGLIPQGAVMAQMPSMEKEAIYGVSGLEAEAAGYNVFSEGFLADNPELMVARRAYPAGIDAMLANNPELIVARRAYPAGMEALLAENPELFSVRRWETCGC